MLLQPQRRSAGEEAGKRPRGVAAARLVAAIPRQAQRPAGRTTEGGWMTNEEAEHHHHQLGSDEGEVQQPFS